MFLICVINLKFHYATLKGQFLNPVFTLTKNYFETDNETKLLKYIWQLKEESKNSNVVICWKIFMHATPYKCRKGHHNLCLTEKYVVTCKNQATKLEH